MKSDIPNILLINPWIHDFAAYDFWAKPMGLLKLGALLRAHGFAVSYIDCLDRFHPCDAPGSPDPRYGRGPYLKTKIPKPPGLEDVPRNYARYGIKPSWFKEDLRSVPPPDLILVTSHMTYWYPGVSETIRIIREILPGVPIILGGIYASLCHDHAVSTSGADEVISGPAENQILDIVGTFTGHHVALQLNLNDLDALPYPAYDLQRNIPYVPLLTSTGCPFSCAYCASHLLNPKQLRRHPASVIEEIQFWQTNHDVNDFVFYDDALLVDAPNHAIPLFEEIIASGLKVRFHTPNAVHIREIDDRLAQRMIESGFESLRLGLETGDFDSRSIMDSKVTADEFKRAVICLKDAGFQKEQVGAYLLAGLPGHSMGSLKASIVLVKACGITPILAYYSPIPRTAMWDEAVASSRYDLEADPIFTNNAIWPCQTDPFSWETLTALKALVSE
ncbi:MAG: radical SAM protein [Desulfobacterales bacterium]